MKNTDFKINRLGAAIVLAFCSLAAYAEESEKEPVMNKDQVEGRVEEAKGKVKEATGVILDDKGMEMKGNVQKNLGKAQKSYGDIKHDIKKED